MWLGGPSSGQGRYRNGSYSSRLKHRSSTPLPTNGIRHALCAITLLGLCILVPIDGFRDIPRLPAEVCRPLGTQ
ncbi:hypothetical protein BU25DRAFT_416044 [Macroventuria anomochaeta]|uniref:Uncharacterized protein n=1 Tax=Macroventuria anomochaeta TaxID=301207 RepID=A0ACB6RHT7_9PLEO|nr:uncharacterized protein BU25DRAFT_416044 [Macroventuria anomochaeta]KAF2621515.1 hypothetical protein BU25DRAFT_416044 [Macroventuria anomochaeta]